MIDAVIAGAGELGIARNDDFNGAVQEGAGYYHLSTRRGWRCSTAVAYLRPARRRPNLRIETGAQATRIAFDRRRASGVSYRRRGAEHTARARREVLLCAGALQTPQLLQLSGVGPGGLLRGFDIPARARAPRRRRKPAGPSAGARHLRNAHRPITTNDDLASFWRTIGMGIDYLFTRDGPMAVGINQGGIFARALPDRNDAGRAIPYRDPFVRHGRLANTRLLRVHDVGLPAAAAIARMGRASARPIR